MAGGKLTPRQKMINLMYLVFIAMLALNMSKEVLTAFGLMNEKFEDVNNFSDTYNGKLLESLGQKAEDKPALFGVPYEKAKRVEKISKELYDYLATIKTDVSKEFEREENGKLPYEAMDKGGYIDENWFEGDKYSAKGNEIVAKIEKYKTDLIAVFGNDVAYQAIVKNIKTRFSLDDVKDKEGVKKKYLSYHFEGFPAIASIAKITSMQNDVQTTEQDAYNVLIGNTMTTAISMKNFQAMVVLEKNVFFEGETVKGKVVLGKYDANTVPTSFSGPGKIENGQAVISMTAGGVGEKTINGTFSFMEDGKPVPLKFEGKYVVVPRPKTANISADKMNVVYRGLDNPMTISFAGIPDSNVSASAPGLSKSSGNGKYNLNPGSGTEVAVSVTAKMPDGTSATDKKVFRIKNIPAPAGAIGKQVGVLKGAKSRLEVSQVTAELQDFLYDLQFDVTRFTFKVPGQPAIIVNGDRVNAQCKAALARATKGDQITISEIKTKIKGGANVITKDASPVVYEIQ
ncbi:gliding motility protein GldM [Flavobacterium sp. J49]|uniref:type IX secretion system motor protein PorM/GldM n=1 Tax=Flavobacterium sp. J49 TaxID=2718534 RepID=UPI0015942296|nr:gliding motility protein GldM [Flavobacterium sp. J49]MBF6640527.1 gliding motility protein GldM [Flavobacterium sp. J49]NIC01774.1 gliding motility protein GldM [Flavobacterium sp. J49]